MLSSYAESTFFSLSFVLSRPFDIHALLDRGAFGAPWITLSLDGTSWESFFGSDRFDVLAAALGQPWSGPVPTSSKL